MTYQESVNELRASFPELATALSRCTNLDRAIQYLAKNEMFSLSKMDVIAQDEFTHDVLVPFTERADYLVLGST
ncbi:MAG: hypothetical protein JST89_00335 [Cyanobacteria bacterium SZAS-4]|nr:hypothetical protein [Cyanobacteria bacterium SZAS-4]